MKLGTLGCSPCSGVRHRTAENGPTIVGNEVLGSERRGLSKALEAKDMLGSELGRVTTPSMEK